ncbi:hypothetical protein LPYR103PRE_22120 [Segatella asaccharophila]
MKKFSLYIVGALLSIMALVSCSPESYEGLDENGLPLAENAQVKVSVADSTNNVTFQMAGEGVYPIWYIPVDGKEVTKNPIYSTLNPLNKIWSNAGDYAVYYRVGNHNGMSQGMGKATFHIQNSLTNYDNIIAMLSAGTWRIASTETGHLACGPSGTDGTSWYQAAPGEKADKGVYDDRLTFSKDGSYSYDPGVGGTVYVNKGCSLFPEYHQDEDYMVPVKNQKTTYTLSTEGDNVYMTMPAGTLFPYIPADDAYKSELKLRIESLLGTSMVLVWDDGTIAWHYILTCADEGFQGYNASSDCNLFKSCKFTNTYYYAPGWAQIPDPVMTSNGNSYTVTLPEATTSQWQAQVFFHTDMNTNAANHYDFSAKLLSTKDHDNVTVKLSKDGDDGTYYFVENIKLKAFEPYIFYKSDLPGLDMDKVNLVLDFGGNQAGTQVTVSDIDLQEHACDGIEAPGGDQDKTVYIYDSPMNLWKSNVDDKGTSGFTPFFYYAPGWAQIANPDLSVDKGTYTISLPTATTDQWQAQVHLITTLLGEADTKYDFCCKLLPTKDIKGVTVKLTDTASDDNYYFLKRVDLAAGQEYTLKVPAVVLPKGAAKALKLVLDFGGNPADEQVKVYNIVFQKTAQ